MSHSDSEQGGRVERKWRGRPSPSRSRSRTPSYRDDEDDGRNFRHHSRSRSRSGDYSDDFNYRPKQRTRRQSKQGQFLAIPEPKSYSNDPSPLFDPGNIEENEPCRIVGKITVYTSRIIAKHPPVTVTYLGKYQGRVAAVKRVPNGESPWLHEIEDSIAVDIHPNIIRLFGWEEDKPDSILVASELCSCSLRDIVSYTGSAADALALRNELWRNSFRILRQLLSAISFIHSMGFMHLNLRPSNVLIPRQTPGTDFRVALSDMGHLVRDPTAFPDNLSYSAPEILERYLKYQKGANGDSEHLDEPSEDQLEVVVGSAEDRPSPISPEDRRPSNPDSTKPKRRPIQPLTPAADIFSLGLLFFYHLTSGQHPFPGLPSKATALDTALHILSTQPDLHALSTAPLCASSPEESLKLIKWMLKREPKTRPSAGIVLHHPFFWSSETRLEFLRVSADRVKVEPLDSPIIAKLEKEASYVFPSGDWLEVLDDAVEDQLTKVSKYDPSMLRDLLKAVRNVRNHVTEMAEEVRNVIEAEGGTMGYFAGRFPKLLMTVFKVGFWRMD
jgi:serine/threonine-protein kinase/endoribonuclease IRE1